GNSLTFITRTNRSDARRPSCSARMRGQRGLRHQVPSCVQNGLLIGRTNRGGAQLMHGGKLVERTQNACRWSAEVQPNYYVVRDANRQQLAYVYYDLPVGVAHDVTVRGWFSGPHSATG